MANITFVVAEITFKVPVITSSVAKITCVIVCFMCSRKTVRQGYGHVQLTSESSPRVHKRSTNLMHSKP